MTLAEWKTTATAGAMFRSLVAVCLLCVTVLSITSTAAAADDEAAARTKFAKQFRDKKPEERVAAVKLLEGVKEDKSITLLASALKDPATEVRKAAAETLEGVTDGGGVATVPLCAVVANKKDTADVRLAAAKALSKAAYKADAIQAYLIAITIDESEKSLYEFATECTKLLNAFAGQDFGLTKETPGKWKQWWKENQQKIRQEDQKVYAAYKKAAAKGK